MVCKSILKDSILGLLYKQHRRYRRRWIWCILLVLIAGFLTSAITQSYWFVALSVIIAHYGALCMHMFKRYVKWAESFTDGWATVKLKGKYVVVSLRDEAHLFSPVMDADAEEDVIHIDFCTGRLTCYQLRGKDYVTCNTKMQRDAEKYNNVKT